jgi:hypothetical protein
MNNTHYQPPGWSQLARLQSILGEGTGQPKKWIESLPLLVPWFGELHQLRKIGSHHPQN